MSVGVLCECCNKETDQDELILRYHAIKKAYLKLCSACVAKYVTYAVGEWEGTEGDGVIPGS